jgi:hypothetical protein
MIKWRTAQGNLLPVKIMKSVSPSWLIPVQIINPVDNDNTIYHVWIETLSESDGSYKEVEQELERLAELEKLA